MFVFLDSLIRVFTNNSEVVIEEATNERIITVICQHRITLIIVPVGAHCPPFIHLLYHEGGRGAEGPN